MLQDRHWFETRTAHFNIYSCGAAREVSVLATRLEQFSEAYTLLGGGKQVSSPPIVVMAFPNKESMKPFVPVYQGQPGDFAGFFKRGTDENLIVLALSGAREGGAGMEVIFHEYAHLLFRGNARVWPLWLSEGMAEIYSTFQTANRSVVIARPIEHHLRVLRAEPIWPLSQLFRVTPDSPQYHEREHQGMFYAESWLLTHFLVSGDIPAFRERFLQFTPLLRDGELPEEAFTNALQVTLAQMDSQLRAYLQRGRFEPVRLGMTGSVEASPIMNSRYLTPVEVMYLLGDELLRIDRMDAAEDLFNHAQHRAPASPLPYEGLGQLAARRERHEDAVRELKKALSLGSTSFLTYYTYARERYRLTAEGEDLYTNLDRPLASELRGDLQKSIALMPSFGPAHELLGFFELVQGDDLRSAEAQLEMAVELEPDNPSYLLTLAQARLQEKNPGAARQALEPLLRPNVDSVVREHARELMRSIDRNAAGR